MGVFVILCFLLFASSSPVESRRLGEIFNRYVEKLAKRLPQTLTNVQEDAGLDVYGLLTAHGYPYESHFVKTEDGYVLGVQRITRGRNETAGSFKEGSKRAVILQHGLLSCAADFINSGQENALGFMLADAGYDVWLSNSRGNSYSRNHTTLDPDKDAGFWDFSFDDCGYYDIPALIDYIKEKTGRRKVFYVGHSQGTSIFFAMAARRPEYNEKVALMTALAPVAYMGHLASPLVRLMVDNMDLLQNLADFFGLHELLGYSEKVPVLANYFCGDNATYKDLCLIGLGFITGFNPNHFDTSFFSVLTSNDPAGISTKMLSHYGQEILSGSLRRYDYGRSGNLRKYKTPNPPDYNVSRITAPIALYYSQNDLMAAVEDVEKLAKQLPNVTSHLMEDKYFNHVDYVWNPNLRALNLNITEEMDKYSDGSDQNGSDSGAGTMSSGFLSVVCGIVIIFCTVV